MAMAGAAAPRLAVVGCGQWGRNLVRNFAALGALDAVVDAQPAQAAALAREHAVPARDWAAVLADPEIDAVALATPAERHAEMAIAALCQGKHVFVEKPLALTVADGERVAAAAADAGRVLMVGHLLQYHPAFLELKALVEAGELGRLQYIYSNRLNFGRIRREENVFWSFAPHDLSMILALAGEPPVKVSAEGCPYLHPHIADVTTTHLSFANGINAHVFVSWLHPFKEQKLVVIGDSGMAAFDDGEPWERKLTVFRHRVAWRHGVPEPAKAAAEPVALAAAEPLAHECQHFLDCVRSGARPRTDAAEGLAVLRVLAMAEAAMRGELPAPPRPQPAGGEVVIHPSAYVDAGCTIGAGTRIWHFSHILKGSRIGRDCVIGQNVMIGPDVVVGDRCKIQNNVSLYKGIVLEDGVFCGPSCVFTNVLTPRAEIERKSEFRPTVVRRGATIGANATLICGHDLGAYCLVAAGAVVTRPVPPFALVAGNPARRIGWVSHAGERLGPDLVCPRTGQRYREAGPDELVEA
jgi:predicted dehydrogenase/acetyltransferase-like isoleucine patch superfamily enzyme